MMTIHSLAPEDAPAVAVVRQAASAHKGEPLGPEARPMFDAMFAATPKAAIAFNTRPQDTAEAAARWIGERHE
ncbi:hypothetical protein [Rhizobium leguminosarum]|uniref:hypothetical protein n=1 Tax=Rhizobium leguminosarum TaxID=384 RepID=UPI001C9413F7|nr:hypothetical protein [Rhizobium leguminosarum]